MTIVLCYNLRIEVYEEGYSLLLGRAAAFDVSLLPAEYVKKPRRHTLKGG